MEEPRHDYDGVDDDRARHWRQRRDPQPGQRTAAAPAPRRGGGAARRRLSDLWELPVGRPGNGRRAATPLVLAGLLAGASISCAHAWHGPVTDHFDGRRFHQPEPLTIGFAEWWKRTTSSHRGAWRRYTDTPPGPPPPRSVSGGDLRVTLVNHATLLIQMDGVNVLTDPIWAKRSVPLIGRSRHRPPGLRFEDLPPIDAVLVSHDHQDHMDLETLRKLAAAHKPAVYTGLGNADFLARRGIGNARDLDWWQTAEVARGVRVTAVPARHLSGRGLFDHNRTLWCGFVLEGPSGSVYFAGDTGWGAHYAEIGKRFPRLRLALLPIGGFLPLYYMREQHLGPEDALQAQRDLNAWTMVPMHFGTFQTGDDAETEAPNALRAALAKQPDLAGRVVLLDNGHSTYPR